MDYYYKVTTSNHQIIYKKLHIKYEFNVIKEEILNLTY